MVVAVIVMNLLKGGKKEVFPSPLGIECGSHGYWIFQLGVILLVLAVSYWGREQLLEKWRLKAKLGYKYAPGDVEWNEYNTIKYPAICFFAGFFAGMFGVGGGIVKGPLMLQMGVHPMVASATVAVMIMFTSIAATAMFIAFGTYVDMVMSRAMAISLFYCYVCSIITSALGSPYLLSPCSITTIPSHITVILIITHLSTSLHLFISKSLNLYIYNAGTLTWDYAIFLFFIGLAFTAIGQFGVSYLIKKYRRVSLVSLSIGAVVAISTVLMTLQTILSLTDGAPVEKSSVCS